MLSEHEHQTREVSELYWNSDASVAEIAEQLQLSRRALYDALTPALAGAACPSCGGDLVFTTRSAKAAERGQCASCGLEQDPAALRTLRSRPSEARSGPSAPIDSEAALLRSRAVLLGTAVVTGLAVGAIAALILSRR